MAGSSLRVGLSERDDTTWEMHLGQVPPVTSSQFRKVTKTAKALHHAFITTYGVAHNLHSGIVLSKVTMNDLFIS